MAQHDLNIANQSFPSFRSDLNNALSAIQTTHSGTSRPTGAVAGQIWLDTTSATSPTLKYYDGADDISLATLDHSANTVNWLDSTVSITGLTTTATGTVLTLTDTHLNSTVSIRIPTTKGIDDDSGNEFLKFTKTASAVNEFTIINSATGSAPEIQSTGSDTNIDLKITPKGSGKIILDGIAFPNADGTANQVLQTNGSGVLSFGSVGATAGQVIQVVSTVKETDQSTTSTSPVDVTDLSVNITPSSTSNKVLVLVNINNIGNSISNSTFFRILRGATVITSNNSGGGADGKNAFGSGGGGGMSNQERKIGSASITFLDTPSSTSALTYKVTFEVDGGTGTINRWQLNTDVASVSTLTLMEIKG